MFKLRPTTLTGTDRWSPAATLRVLLSVMLVFAVFIGPYSYAAERHAEHHESHSASDHHGGMDSHGQSDDEEHKGVGHALTHCGSTACAPSFVGTPVVSTRSADLIFRLHTWIADDLDVPSLYLDSDPPVPRSGFSLI